MMAYVDPRIEYLRKANEPIPFLVEVIPNWVPMVEGIVLLQVFDNTYRCRGSWNIIQQLANDQRVLTITGDFDTSIA